MDTGTQSADHHLTGAAGHNQDRRPGIDVMKTSPSLVVALAVGGACFVAAPSGAQHPVADPSIPVRLVLSQVRYAPGAHGRVYVRVGTGGYLMVLHAQPDGHVQIVFPLDPGDNPYVYPDSEIEIRARGNRDAFTVDDSSGTGTWYAAISRKPFHFDPISVSTHWDYRDIPHVLAVRDAEDDLTALIQRVATAPFEYDIVQYRITTPGSLTTVADTPGAPDGGATPPPPQPPPDDPDGPWWLGPFGGGPWIWPGWIWPHPGPGPGPYYNRVAPGSQSAPSGAGAPSGTGVSSADHGAGEPHEEPHGDPGSHHDHAGGSSPHH